jgi:hypothetical protein
MLRRFSLTCFGLAIALLPLTGLNSPAAETKIQYLSGTSRQDAVPWEFKADGGRHAQIWTNIAVPSCWEQEGFGAYRYGQDTPPATITAIYRHSFSLEDLGQKRARLWFEGVMTDAEVLVNGKPAGPVHSGGFSPFWFDVTRLLKTGANHLEVRVAENSANPILNKAERYADFWLFGGIHRPVYLEILPPEFIDRVAVDARADGTLTMEAFLGDPSAQNREVVVQLLDPSGKPFGAPIKRAVPSGATRVGLSARFDSPELWSNETPVLYTLDVRLLVNDSPAHHIREQIGFRTFEVLHNGGFRLNGKRIVLKGVCRAAFRPETGRTLSAADSIADVRIMKAMNCNAIRAGHYPADRHFLKACDELGLLVLEELFGWQAPVPDDIGAQLVREMVHRDQNHPSIVFWANGNHQAFNPTLEAVFHESDLQKRRALRMEPRMGSLPMPATPGLLPVDTRFYPLYTELVKRLRDPYPVCPFETLHALYDGGGGAGLADYMAAIEGSPSGGGLFIWEMVDEAIARTDKNGELDASGTRSCDGVIGPHHEPEASYFTARAVFSPIQIQETNAAQVKSTGRVTLINKSLFKDLKEFSFVRELGSGAQAGNAGVARVKSDVLPSPTASPGQTAELDLRLNQAGDFDFVRLIAKGADGVVIRDWSWPLKERATYVPSNTAGQVEVRRESGRIDVRAASLRFSFDETSGRLMEARSGAKAFPMRDGPDIVWATSAGSALSQEVRDGIARADDANPGKKKKAARKPNERLMGRLSEPKQGDGGVVVTQHPDRAELAWRNVRGFQTLRWNVHVDGTLGLEYSYSLNGTFESFGITFDSDESTMRSVKWLGQGPHPIWKNRTEGGTFGLWSKQFIDTEPGKLWVYPYSKGCHADTFWFTLENSVGSITAWIISPEITPRWFTPRFGAEEPMNARAFLPPGDLGFLHAVPAIGEKWHPAEDLGPSGQPTTAQGTYSGSLRFRFN